MHCEMLNNYNLHVLNMYKCIINLLDLIDFRIALLYFQCLIFPKACKIKIARVNI